MDQSLDDVIASKKFANRGRGGFRGGRDQGSKPRGRGGRGGRGGSTFWRNPALSKGVSKPVFSPRRAFQSPKATLDAAWTHDQYQEDDAEEEYEEEYEQPEVVVAPVKSLHTGGKILVSNLHFEVSDADIKDLFSTFGTLKKASINYDASGRSLGTATVIFESRASAIKAQTSYNGVTLDGKPMNIELVSNEVAAPVARAPVARAPAPRFTITDSIGETEHVRVFRTSGAPRGGRGRGNGRGRGGFRGGRGGRGGSRSKSEAQLNAELEKYNPTTAEDLNAQLDAYNAASA